MHCHANITNQHEEAYAARLKHCISISKYFIEAGKHCQNRKEDHHDPHACTKLENEEPFLVHVDLSYDLFGPLSVCMLRYALFLVLER